VVNLEDSNLELDDLTIPSKTQGVAKLGDLLCLPRLQHEEDMARAIGRLFQFTCGHIIPLLNSVEPKALEKEVVDKIKE
jgi:hypothetical protein